MRKVVTVTVPKGTTEIDVVVRVRIQKNEKQWHQTEEFRRLTLAIYLLEDTDHMGAVYRLPEYGALYAVASQKERANIKRALNKLGWEGWTVGRVKLAVQDEACSDLKSIVGIGEIAIEYIRRMFAQ